MTNKNKHIARGLLVGLAVFILGWTLFALDIFRGLEAKTWDWRQGFFADPAHADRRIVLVLIDQNSLDVYAEQGYTWPWMREMYVPLIEYCRRGGARALFIDMHFSEPSVFGEDDDSRLAEAVGAAGQIFLPAHFSAEEKETPLERLLLLNRFGKPVGEGETTAAREMRSVLLPVPELLSAAHGIGDVQIAPDSDGIYRRTPLHTRLAGRIYPVLPLAVAEDESEGPIPDIPLDGEGNMLIRFHGPAGTYPTYSAAAVINSYVQEQSGMDAQLPLETFKDKYVLLGGSAPGIMDLKSTPLSRICPGTEINAAVLDNLLNRDFMRKPPAGAAALWLALTALAAGLGFTLTRRIGLIVLLAIGLFALPAAVAAAGFAGGIWIPFVAPEFTILVGFAVATLLNYNLEGRRRRFVKRVFNHYLSRHVIDRVLKNPDLLKLGGEQREVTSFFSDVAGFTGISEGLTPEELVQLLNEYLSAMTDIILESGGTLDKYEGDAIIAFWNAPLDQTDHALRAVRTALRCQDRLTELRTHFEQNYGHALRMRIGLNTGPAVVGNMGSRSRFDYTAMGDTINLAARLEGACKAYSVPILMGETTFAAVSEEIASRRVDLIRVVGKSKPVHVYQPLSEETPLPESDQTALDTFHKAQGFYRGRRWEEALGLFRQLEDDKLAHVYIGRAVRMQADPPPEDWDGIFDLTSK